MMIESKNNDINDINNIKNNVHTVDGVRIASINVRGIVNDAIKQQLLTTKISKLSLNNIVQVFPNLKEIEFTEIDIKDMTKYKLCCRRVY